MNESLYTEIAHAEANGTRVCVVTVVSTKGSTPRKSGAKMLVYPDGKTAGTIGGGAVERVVVEKAIELCGSGEPTTFTFSLEKEAEQKENMLCGGEMTFFLEPLGYAQHLHIFGGGHCGLALAQCAAHAGFVIHVYDDRPEIVSSDRFPHAASLQCDEYAKMSAHLRCDENDYIAIMTQGHIADEIVLENVLKSGAKYIGMMASTRKRKEVFSHLSDKGISDDVLKRIHSPIGVDINAETPEEIAVSIVAELISVSRSERTTKTCPA